MIAVLLGLIALFPRIVGLADFLTTDEAYHWITRTERFSDALTRRDWVATLQTGHPGVTLMWLGSIGLAIERFAVAQGWADVRTTLDHLAWLRLAPAIFQSLAVPFAYLLLRRLVTPLTALLAALLWATSPYLIAHSRLLHLDALLTTFVTLSVLLILVATKDEGRGTADGGCSDRIHHDVKRPPPYPVISFSNPKSKIQNPKSPSPVHVPVIASGVFAGLALLTKGPALILLPIIGLLLFFRTRFEPSAFSGQQSAISSQPSAFSSRLSSFVVRRSSFVSNARNTQHSFQLSAFSFQLSAFIFRLRVVLPWYFLWLAVAFAVVVLLWPALWANPALVFDEYVSEIASNGGRPNGDGQFFLGQAIADPGPWFYLVANLFRMTPAMLVGLLAYFGFWILDLRSKPANVIQNPKSKIQNHVLLALVAFILFWTLVMTLGPKKFDRYVLPTWPALCVLAAAGLARIGDWRLEIGDPRAPKSLISNLQSLILRGVVVLLLVVEFALSPIYHPYYLSYYNPLLGGGAVAERSLLIGWGEGMDQVGAALRERPDIEHGPVLSALRPTLQPFVPVPVIDIDEYGQSAANYAVVYLESLQRGANPEIYAAIQQTVPLRTITIHGIDYANIHQLPKPFAQPIGASFGESLHLRGVTLTRDANALTVTPSWDVRGAIPADYTMFVHLLDAQGGKAAQVDIAPGGGNAPSTHVWQPGEQIAVPIILSLPADLPAGDYQLVLGLYDTQSGARIPFSGGAPADATMAGPDALLVDLINIVSKQQPSLHQNS
jgi:4-amino-4-deoxy-L-arabinose transferase-like glycosyltransferase